MIFSISKNFIKILFIGFLISSFSACSYHKIPMTFETGTNDFHSLVSKLVDESARKIKGNINLGDVVLVSDFVNLDNLKNRSQLGFLLSDILKDKLVSLDIIVREVELANNFEYGRSGLNLLTRNKNDIASDKVKERFAVVGTYSITSKSLNVFIKLIDINTGNILSSSYERTDIDEEILQLEGQTDNEGRRTLRPRVVL